MDVVDHFLILHWLLLLSYTTYNDFYNDHKYKMRYTDLLNEMPVASFTTVGELGTDFKTKKGFNDADWKVTHNDKAIAKIYRIFEKTPFLFNFIIVFDYNGTMMFNRNTTPEQLAELVGKPIDTEGAITVVYNNHVTGDRNRMPISAWTLAHRLGHAAHLNSPEHGGGGEKSHPFAKLWYKIDHDLAEMIAAAFKTHLTAIRVQGGRSGNPQTTMAAMFCTFKSARDNNMNSEWEVIADLFAQYLISGKIRLNRLLNVTQPLNFDLSEMSDADYEKINAYIDKAEKTLNDGMEAVLKSLVGKIIGF